MKITGKRPITNYEVLQCLRGYATYRTSNPVSEDPEKVQLENSVRAFLNSTRIKTVTRPQIEEVKNAIVNFRMSRSAEDCFDKAEVLQLINTLPTTQEELFLIVKNIEQRMTEEEIGRVIDIIRTAIGAH